MAIGWLSVLKLVPWGDVIDNAPKVAQGAKKLWGSVTKKAVDVTGPDLAPMSGVSDNPQTMLTALQAQVTELQLRTAELHQHLVQSSALLESLAEQNAQLIVRVEVNRRRTWGLMLALSGLAVALIVLYIR